MLGRKNYTQEELDHCMAAVDQQLAAYKALSVRGRHRSGLTPAETGFER